MLKNSSSEQQRPRQTLVGAQAALHTERPSQWQSQSVVVVVAATGSVLVALRRLVAPWVSGPPLQGKGTDTLRAFQISTLVGGN